MHACRLLRLIPLLLLLCVPARAAEVLSFSPQGEVKAVRQATARFAAPMVAFGDPRETAPFEVSCPVSGKGRWADEKNWVYDFAAEVPAGLVCEFRLKEGLAALDGRALKGGEHFAFNSGGPAVLDMEPRQGSAIDEKQVFILGLDAPAKIDTIRSHVACVVKGLPERQPVVLLAGAERKAILDQRAAFLTRYYQLVSQEGRSLASFGIPESGNRREAFLMRSDGPDSALVVLRCLRPLPNDAEVSLVWGAGIAAASPTTDSVGTTLPSPSGRGARGEGESGELRELASPTVVVTTKARVLNWKVRKSFEARFSCERLHKDGACLPMLPMELRFSAPIRAADARHIRLVDGAGQGRLARLPKGAEDFVSSVSFPFPLPERTAFKLEIPSSLKDDAGRALVNADRFPLAVPTDEYPPLAKFSARFGIIEKNAEPGTPALLPVTLRNLETTVAGTAARAGLPGESLSIRDEKQVIAWLRRLQHLEQAPEGSDEAERGLYGPGMQSVFHLFPSPSGRGARGEGAQGERRESLRDFPNMDARKAFTLPKPGGGKAFEVVGIPLPGTGFHVVELASPRLGAALLEQKRPYRVAAAALVTNLAVHFKQGRESSLVWVTSLDKGEAVAGAEVAVRDCGGKLYARGKSDALGRFPIRRALPPRDDLPSCLDAYDHQYFVSARSGDDFSFVLSDWNEGIAPWRFNLPQGSREDSVRAHAVLDRSLFRAGETLHMKLFLRRATRGGFGMIDVKPQEKITLIHLGSDDKFELPVQWAADGSAVAQWPIPAEAKQGAWEIRLNLPGRNGSQVVEAGAFRVESFRVPSMKASLQGTNLPLVNAPVAELALQVNYLNGGGAADLPVKLRGQILPREIAFPDYEDFSFANGDVKTGRSTRDFSQEEAPDEDAGDAGEGDAGAASALRLPQQELRLGTGGAGKALLAGLGGGTKAVPADRPRELLAELEYRDANGETLTSGLRLPLWPSRLLVGLKTDSWLEGADSLRLQAVVLDLAGKPVAGSRVQVDAFKQEFHSNRRRLLGGFYAYEHFEETKSLGELCQGLTDARGLLVCEVKAPAKGSLILRARTVDGEGHASIAHREVSLSGEESWRGGSDQDRMDLLPAKKAYEPGQTAKFEVRMPFKRATVLVTVEREGVLESRVVTLTRKNPVIELPITAAHAPNIFVSALAIRGRIAGPAPTALVDLGKPAFRMGMAEIRVGHGAHQLKVEVSADKPAYPVRGKVKLSIQVRRMDGSAPPKGMEVALAAVDEGLLELMPNQSWKLLEAMMKRRGIEVETATAQMQVVGKRHFGKKALPAGGGGGKGASRELFDTLLLWQPRVKLDAEGRAEVEVPLNDSLTSFRIVAVAAGETGLFGTGATSIRSTQDLMLVGGLPPLVREQDRYRAGFTVRNASARTVEAEVSAMLAKVAGGKPDGGRELAPIAVSLAAGEARDIGWDVEVPVGADGLQWQVAVGEKGGDVGDRLKLSQKIIPAVPVRTLQATLMQIDKSADLAVALPAGAIPGRGGIRVSLRGRLADELAGVKEWMERYPYTCLEQQASQAVALADKARWTKLMAKLPVYLDGDGLAKYFPGMEQGSEVLSAYLLGLAAESGGALPEASGNRMKEGLRAFVEGRVRRYSDLPVADLTLRKLAAMAALSHGGPANAGWLDSLSLEPNLWPSSALIDWITILKRSPALPHQAERLTQAQHILRSRLNFQGTTLSFSTERNDTLWWLMAGGDVNANRALLTLMDLPDWQADLPRLVTGTLGRQQQGHWNTTVANAWGSLAMARFSARFEAQPVAGRTDVKLVAPLALGRGAGGEGDSMFLASTPPSFTNDWASQPEGARRILPWPTGGSGASPSPPRPTPKGEGSVESRAATLTIRHAGSGKPWATLQSLAALPLKEPLFTGFRIVRSVTPVSQQVPGRWRRGDVARVKLELESLADMGWVVVSDPIPAGATVLGSGLGGDSILMTRGEKKADWWSAPTFEERTFEAYRAYYRFLPKGKWRVEYTVRLNNSGDFQLPPTRVEAMYAPEMFGELPNASFVVGQ